MAEDDRLASMWKSPTSTADGQVRYSLAKLRGRARELADNDPYISKYYQMLDDNVVGEKGIVPIPEPPSKRKSAEIDTFAAARITAGWKEFSKKGNFTVCGMYSAADLQKRIIRSVSTDGELFLIETSGPAAGNRFGYALEVMEADLLDETYNAELENGNTIRMGVEVNRYRRPVAYHFLVHPPGDYLYPAARSSRSEERRRVPADRVIHCAREVKMRPGQTRAVTWFTNVGPSLYQLHGYRKAEGVAARAGAEKMGFYKSLGEEEWDGDYEDVDESRFIQESEAGAFEILPKGWDLVPWDPDHPSTAFDPFNKAMTRTAASGLNVGYNPLASDAEGTSYGTLRQFALDDRGFFRSLQTWITEGCGFEDRIFPHWLQNAMIHDAVKLSPLDFDRLAIHRWQGRGWQWIDPQKESNGNETALKNTTRLVADTLAETSGRTLDEHLAGLKREREKYEAAGFKHPSERDPAPAPPEGSESAEKSEEDEGEE